MNDLSIKERLQSLYNCKIVKAGIGDKNIKIHEKRKVDTKKLLGIIPISKYEITERIIDFDDAIRLTRENLIYNRIVYDETVEVAYDDFNRVVYWKKQMKFH